MSPKLTIIDTPAGIESLLSYIADFEYVAYDCETTGVTKDAEVIGVSVCADESESFYVILSKWENGQLVSLDTKKEIFRLIEVLKTKSLIMHNGVFDCSMAEQFFKIRLIEALHTDTMILAHLLDENRRVGLKELGSELFGESAIEEQKIMNQSVAANGGALTKKKYEMYKADAYLMARYGAKDAWLTFKLFQHFVPQLFESNLDDFFYHDESMPLLKGPTYDLNTVGLQVDREKLISLKKTLEAECLEARDFIYSEITPLVQEKYPGTSKKNTFNIGSNVQLSWLLFGKLGLEFNTLTSSGRVLCKQLEGRLPYSPAAKRSFIEAVELLHGSTQNGKKIKEPWAYIACDKEALKKHASKYKWIEKLLEYQKKTKILTTYVEGIEERLSYGVIYPSFLQHGTTSGRYSSRNPNFQNLPRDDKRVKSLITARAGRVYVGADYSQLEPRVFAYFSGDPRLQRVFDSTDDFYSVIGMEVYGKTDCLPVKEGSPDAFGIKYKKLRDLSKVIALASTYGATAHQLTKTTGKNASDTQEDIDSYFERFPNVAKMMTDSHETAKKLGYVTNLFGRPRRIPEAKAIDRIYGKRPHKELPYEARQKLNLAVNHRIQSTGASIVNRAAIAFYALCAQVDVKCVIVCQVHDSLVVECKEQDAEIVADLLQYAMENTVELPGVKLEAIPKIGKTLAEV